ncbi:MAG: hypothetical protein KDE56_31285, partial [Anaerolineales bacterium]|nr:hypothetical protein [Anaerolineales bacterium]
MSKERLRKNKIALGDFQTPTWFAHEVCGFLGQDIRPRSVLEPTCGLGNFLIAALDTFETIESGIGVEIKPDYVQAVQERLANHVNGNKIEVYHTNFLTTDWSLLWNQVPEPLLIIGNPPWVTNAQLGKLASQNLPPKSNFKEQPGLVALMGSSNFDISEWMLL